MKLDILNSGTGCELDILNESIMDQIAGGFTCKRNYKADGVSCKLQYTIEGSSVSCRRGYKYIPA